MVGKFVRSTGVSDITGSKMAGTKVPKALRFQPFFLRSKREVWSDSFSQEQARAGHVVDLEGHRHARLVKVPHQGRLLRAVGGRLDFDQLVLDLLVDDVLDGSAVHGDVVALLAELAKLQSQI